MRSHDPDCNTGEDPIRRLGSGIDDSIGLHIDIFREEERLCLYRYEIDGADGVRDGDAGAM